MSASSIFHDSQTRIRAVLVCLLAFYGGLSGCKQLGALDPGRSSARFTRDTWKTETGFPGGPINSIAQTTDGYLWIGTDKGLVRFDGTNFVTVSNSGQLSLPGPQIFGLVGDEEGNLWIRFQSPDLLRYRDGKFTKLRLMPEIRDVGITAMSRGSGGELLISTIARGSFRYSKGKLQSILSQQALPNPLKISMTRTTDGRVWIGTQGDGLFYIKDSKAIPVTEGVPDKRINCLLATSDGHLWIGTDKGVVQWDGKRVTQPQSSIDQRQFEVLTMLQDRDSNLWIGTSHGLLRLRMNGSGVVADTSSPFRGPINALFEDREGDLWIGGPEGLERMRDSPFVMHADVRLAGEKKTGPIWVDQDGRTWFAPFDGGLCWMKGGESGRVTASGISKDVVYSITGGKDGIWVGRKRGGLSHITFRGLSMHVDTYTTSRGLAQNNVFTVGEMKDGTVWAGTLSGGVSEVKGGKIKTYTLANGLSSNGIRSIQEGNDGSVWFATANGLNRLASDVWRTFLTSDGLPSTEVTTLFQDREGALWIGTESGLAYFDQNQIHRVDELQEWLGQPIFGIQEDRSGSLWIASTDRIFEVKRSALMNGKVADGNFREFGVADGLDSSKGVPRDRSVVSDNQGQIWFSTEGGIASVDPARANAHSVPPLAHIDEIDSDGISIPFDKSVSIGPNHQRIIIRYAGLSLAEPDRIRFKYKLDGFDQTWSNPVSSREAVYTNLAPATYDFHVIASDMNGLWNGPEATLPFTISPSFWQTNWFRITVLVSVLLIVWLVYYLRMLQLTKRWNIRFEERLTERMRIARDLHDTLLQGFLSASLQLDVIAKEIPENSPAKFQLDRILELMDEVTDEGREALRGLRSQANKMQSLEEAISLIPQTFESNAQTGFRVIIDGISRPLHPVIQDEVYRIGREAVMNAFRHAKANHVDVEITYKRKSLIVVVRDDGCGVDEIILQTGRSGHWGIQGMRERVEEIGAKLEFWSRTGAGTEVSLTVPGRVAFSSQAHASRIKALLGARPSKGRRREDRP